MQIITKNNSFLKVVLVAICLVALSVTLVGCKSEPKITSIAVDTDASYLYLEQGDSIDNLDIVVIGTYNDNDKTTIQLDKTWLTFGDLDTSTTGEKTLDISYDSDGETLSATANVVVTPKITSISYKSGLNTRVAKGGTVDTSNLVITLNYADGTTQDVSNKYISFMVDSTDETGMQIVTISYKKPIRSDLVCTVIVSVYDIQSIKINTEAPTLYQYIDADYSSLGITVTYTDNVTEDIKYDGSNMTLSGVDTNESGTQTLTVQYKNVTDTQAVEVAKLSSIEYKSGLPEQIAKDSNVSDYAKDLVITATYDNGKTLDITYDDDDFTIDLDTTKDNTQTATINYHGCSFDKEVTVITSYDISLVSDPKFVTNLSNVAQNEYNTTSSTGAKGFAETPTTSNYVYLVGYQNTWKYLPIVSGLVNDVASELTAFSTEIKVYLVENETETLLSDTELAKYMTIDNYNQTYDFTTDAIDKTFKIDVSVVGDPKNYISEFTFKVIDAYNVYNATDLSVFDNVNSDGKWTEWKNAHNVSLDIEIHGIVLQDNINITDLNIPAVHFWTADEVKGATDASAAEGSLKDSTGDKLGFIYSRSVTDGSTFKFNGNFYTINAEKLALIERVASDSSWKTTASGDVLTTHTTLFGFYGDTSVTNYAKYELNDTSFIGNTQKTEEAKYSGGVICFKKEEANMIINNSIFQCWFIALFSNEGHDRISGKEDKFPLTLNNVNVFDSYNTILYNWGGVTNINSCTMIGAGGPVMICDHVDNNKTDGTGGIISTVTTTNSTLESWVAGTEGWFVAYGATALATQIKSMDQLFNKFNKTILNTGSTTMMNLIAVYKSSEVEGLSSSVIRGTFTDTNTAYTNGLDLSSSNINSIKQTVMTSVATANGGDQKATAAVLANTAIVQTYNGAVFVPRTSGLLYPTDESTQTQEGIKFAQAQGYANLYLFNGMAAVFGMYDYSAS